MYDVNLTWKLADKGGKLFQPSTGEYFCTTALVDLSNKKTTWSIKLIFNEVNPLKVKLEFLFDNYPKSSVKNGDTIELFEGPNIVGYALIQNSDL